MARRTGAFTDGKQDTGSNSSDVVVVQWRAVSADHTRGQLDIVHTYSVGYLIFENLHSTLTHPVLSCAIAVLETTPAVCQITLCPISNGVEKNVVIVTQLTVRLYGFLYRNCLPRADNIRCVAVPDNLTKEFLWTYTCRRQRGEIDFDEQYRFIPSDYCVGSPNDIQFRSLDIYLDRINPINVIFRLRSDQLLSLGLL